MARAIFSGISAFFANAPYVQDGDTIKHAFLSGDSLFFQGTNTLYPTLSTSYQGDTDLPTPFTIMYQTAMVRSALFQVPLFGGLWNARSYRDLVFTSQAMLNVKTNTSVTCPPPVIPRPAYVYNVINNQRFAQSATARNKVYVDFSITTLFQMDINGFALPLLFNPDDNGIDVTLALTSLVGQSWSTIVGARYESAGNAAMDIDNPIHRTNRALMLLYLGSACGYFNPTMTWNGFYFRQAGKPGSWGADLDPILVRGDSALINRATFVRLNRWVVFKDFLWQMSRGTLHALVLGGMICAVEQPLRGLSVISVLANTVCAPWTGVNGRAGDEVTTIGLKYVAIENLIRSGSYTVAEGVVADAQIAAWGVRNTDHMDRVRAADDANVLAGVNIRRVKPWDNGGGFQRLAAVRALVNLMAANTR
uniref:Core clamp n=1 Tax=Piscine orthoreovirus TaxID=1157337 RepID=A0A3G1RQ51_9REOV|nr:core clamp [Piscine orthoreovirus]AXF48144.1 core clamp [Piscine orthoreovirus]